MLVRVSVRSASQLWLARRDASRLERQLPLVAQVLAAHLKAGRSLRQAIAESAADLPVPSCDRIRAAAASLDLGASPAEALAMLGHGEDVHLLTCATVLHTRCGGDLAALFDGIAEALHERAALRRSAAVATAQARATGRLVSAMPVVAMASLWLLDRPALTALLASPLGWAALAFSAMLVFVGHLLIGRIAAVDP